jgi:hypothetical protein
MRKPGWWTGSWFVKSALIWFGGFLIWLPVFTRWPSGVLSRIATAIFLLSMLPFAFLYAWGVLGRLLGFILFVYTAIASSVGGTEERNGKRVSRLR